MHYGEVDGRAARWSSSFHNDPCQSPAGRSPGPRLVHLLIYALENKLAGTIDIASPDQRVASVLFVGGEPAKAHVSEPVSRLGQVLVDLGFMTAQVLDRRWPSSKTRERRSARPLRRIPAHQGAAGYGRMEAGLREQVVRRLRYMARCRPRRPTPIYDGFDALRGIGIDSPRGVDPLPMLWTLLSERAPQAHVDAALARVAAARLRISRTAELSCLGLGVRRGRAIESVRVRPLTVAEFPRISGLAEREARLLMYLLLVTKQVEVIAPSRSSMPPRPIGRRTPLPVRTSIPPAPGSPLHSSFPPKSSVPPRVGSTGWPQKSSVPPGAGSTGWPPKSPVPPGVASTGSPPKSPLPPRRCATGLAPQISSSAGCRPV